MSIKIAILGWGSLLWDPDDEFNKQLAGEKWELDGPALPLEFSRISERRKGALTLVIDPANGTPSTVAWRRSKRCKVEDARRDLQCRESTSLEKIGWICLTNVNQPDPAKPDRITLNRSDPSQFDEHEKVIYEWAKAKQLDAVIWTNLGSNFGEKAEMDGKAFSLENALAYLKGLPSDGKAKAFEYIVRAPDFVKTPLRTAVEKEPWFKEG